jgi:WD40 repeat protein
MAEFLEFTPSIGALAFSPDGQSLSVAYLDGVVEVRRIEDGELAHRLEHDVIPAAERLTYSPDGAYLATVGIFGSPLAVWRLEDGKLLWQVPNAGWLSPNRASRLSPFSPDGSLLASISRRGIVSLRRTTDGGLVRSLRSGLEDIEEAGFTPDGKMLGLLGGFRTSADDIWEPVIQFRWVSDGALVPDGDVPADQRDLLGVDGGGRAMSDLGPGPVGEGAQVNYMTCGIPPEGHVCGLQGVGVMADGEWLAWGAGGSGLFWWHILEGAIVGADLPEEEYPQVDMSADGETATVCTGAGIEMVNPSEGSRVTVPGRCQRGGAVLSPGGMSLVTWASNRIQRISLPEGTDLGAFLGHQHPVSQVLLSRDGAWMASGAEDSSPGGFRGPSEVIVWELDPPKRVRTLDWWGSIYSLSFSDDAKLIAAGGTSDTARVWRVADGWLLMTLPTAARALAFSPDGELLATGGWDGTIRLWKVPDGTGLTTLSGHTEEIVGLAFTDDGTVLVSASFDGTVKSWGVK